MLALQPPCAPSLSDRLAYLRTFTQCRFAQVGDLAIDHNLTARDPLAAEQYLGRPPPRPVLFITDLIAEVVSAFAAASLVFDASDKPRALRLREHARYLYAWMASPEQVRAAV